jgi:hypothetical protein
MQLNLAGVPTDTVARPPDFLCPFGCDAIRRSEYLTSVFAKDPYGEWAANLVTHYRHRHIHYYDRSWRSGAYAAKNPEYVGHDQFKAIINNRAKRQLIRAIAKMKEWPLWRRRLLVDAFLRLQFTDEETRKLVQTIRLK